MSHSIAKDQLFVKLPVSDECDLLDLDDEEAKIEEVGN